MFADVRTVLPSVQVLDCDVYFRSRPGVVRKLSREDWGEFPKSYRGGD